MTNPYDNLRSIDLDGIRPVFDELAGHEADAGRQWTGDQGNRLLRLLGGASKRKDRPTA